MRSLSPAGLGKLRLAVSKSSFLDLKKLWAVALASGWELRASAEGVALQQTFPGDNQRQWPPCGRHRAGSKAGQPCP